MSTFKSRLMKTMLTAPLAFGLLASSGCAADIREASSSTPMPNEVKENIANTMSTFTGMSDDQEFMNAVFQFSMSGGDLEGFEEKIGDLDELVADGSGVDNVKETAQEALLGQNEEEMADEDLEFLAKSSPLLMFASSYSFEGIKVPIVIDPSGFEERDGVWYAVKNGAIGFQDDQNRYVAFTTAQDNFSFSSDGKKLTLDGLSDSLDKVEEMNTDAMMDTQEATQMVDSWVTENFDTLAEDTDFATLQDKMLEGFSPKGDTEITVTGDMQAGYVVVGKSVSTGEEVVYDVTVGEFQSNKAEDEPEPKRTDGAKLFDEYMMAYYESGETGSVTLDALVDTVSNNDENTDAKWQVSELDGERFPLVKFNGVEYRFFNVVDNVHGHDEEEVHDHEEEVEVAETEADES